MPKKGYFKIYNFLKNKYCENSIFTIQDFSNFTNLKPSSIKVYIRNKLKDRFLKIEPDGKYRTLSEISFITEIDFFNYLSQKDIIKNNDISEVNIESKFYKYDDSILEEMEVNEIG